MVHTLLKTIMNTDSFVFDLDAGYIMLMNFTPQCNKIKVLEVFIYFMKKVK